MTSPLHQMTNETLTALKHVRTLYGADSPRPEPPRINSRRNPVRRVRRRWRSRQARGQSQRARLASATHVNPADRRSVARHIYDQARARGYSDHDATAIVAYSIGESNLNPAISGGPQGGTGAAHTVIGLFQEKPAFAEAGGVNAADRYTVQGNTTAYLNQLVTHRQGDIFDQLLATSKGGPMHTGGRSAMLPLLAQARALLGGSS